MAVDVKTLDLAVSLDDSTVDWEAMSIGDLELCSNHVRKNSPHYLLTKKMDHLIGRKRAEADVVNNQEVVDETNTLLAAQKI